MTNTGGDYTVRIKRSAEKEMDRLDGQMFQRVAQMALRLERDPRPPGCKKLRGMIPQAATEVCSFSRRPQVGESRRPAVGG